MQSSLNYLRSFLLGLMGIFLFVCVVVAQEPKKSEPQENSPKKINSRPAEAIINAPDPFDGASVEKMAQQCVTLETQVGTIEMEMIPEVAPESVRNFLNLVRTGALDTT
ncbi:MAG: peptidylprolyl isomerase, partial [Acidobacteriota bacterium]|nr:peptidylprolyl isomerase [Acidobacteriota bacterium]